MTRPHAALVRTYVPALVGAGASVLLARILPVSPFFLVPIGVVAAMRGALPVGITVLLAVVFNFSMVLFSSKTNNWSLIFSDCQETVFVSSIVVAFCNKGSNVS